MSNGADHSGAVLAARFDGLEANFHAHVDHSVARSDALNGALSELVRVSHQQALSLTDIVSGQKATDRLLKLFLTVAGLAVAVFAAMSVRP